MKKVKLLFLLLNTNLLISDAQINKNLSSNISKSELQKLYFYEQIKPFDSSNFIYIAYKGMGSVFPNAKIVLLKKNGKLKQVIKLKYETTDTSQWKNKIYYEHKRTPLTVTQFDKKTINKYLKQTNWNQYQNKTDSNYFCRETEINNKQYLEDVYNVVNVDDGDSRVIIIKINNKVRIISLYMWSDFLTVCNLTSHVFIEELYKKLYSLLPK